MKQKYFILTASLAVATLLLCCSCHSTKQVSSAFDTEAGSSHKETASAKADSSLQQMVQRNLSLSFDSLFLYMMPDVWSAEVAETARRSRPQSADHTLVLPVWQYNSAGQPCLAELQLPTGLQHHSPDALQGWASGMVPVVAAYGISISDSTKAQSDTHAASSSVSDKTDTVSAKSRTERKSLSDKPHGPITASIICFAAFTLCIFFFVLRILKSLKL